MGELFLGIDLGTSGIRCAVIDDTGHRVAMTRGAYPDETAEGWWVAVAEGLDALKSELGDAMSSIAAAAVDGTSGSMVLVDHDLTPVTAPLMYNSGGFDAEAAMIAPHAPAGHMAHGPGSALARLLRLQSQGGSSARHMCHQADFILASLRRMAGASDENNALKTGYDPQNGVWPDWMAATGLRMDLLPDVLAVGTRVGVVDRDIAARFGFSPDLALAVGTTDSIAAFLASGAKDVGEAVTSLGTTLVVKMISERRIDNAAKGVYSHKLGAYWLVGGASNTGGGALLAHFTPEEMTELSTRIDPSVATVFDYYPLPRPGERFPVNDPHLAPRETPRPPDDHLFFHGLLEGIARIEAQSYALLAEMGAPDPSLIYTAGGGGQNPVWTAIRQRVVSPKVTVAAQTEAAIGTALLAQWDTRV